MLVLSVIIVFLLFGALWLAAVLHEHGLKPMRRMAELMKRPAAEIALVTLVAIGMIHHGATKGTNGVNGAGGETGDRGMSGEVGGLRNLPPEIEALSNALAITAFDIDVPNREVAFELSWASNLFDYTDSRNLFLFSATDLQDRQWTPIGEFLMPSGTNVHAFAVTTNDVYQSELGWFLDSFNGIGFYRFAADLDSDGDGLIDSYETWWTFTDPGNPDTDGDGLTDGQEISAEIGTNPLLPDTDGDGVGDADEIAAGTNPHSADSDGDGLTDAQELGSMSAQAGDDFLWLDIQDATPLITWPTVSGESWRIPLEHDVTVNGVCYTNARVHADGTVQLLCPTNIWSWGNACSYGTLSNTQYSALHITVGLCGAYLYAMTNEWGSQIFHGVASKGGHDYTVVEYRNIGLSNHTDTNELITCQLILPHDETNVIYVSYLCASNLFREVSLVAGVQCGWLDSWKAGERYHNLTWPQDADFPSDGLTIRYSIGTGTNPMDVDTDCDGLTDSEEVMFIHSDPFRADTDGDGLADGEEIVSGTDPISVDSDRDGMPDGWEVRNSLDPTVIDSMDDADMDGVSNLDEYLVGTDPNDTDSDLDGLTDRQELGWWEYAGALPVFDVSGGTSLLQPSRNYDSAAFVVPLPFEVRCGGYIHTNVTICVDGAVGLMNDDHDYSFSVYHDNEDFATYEASVAHTAIAAYWDDLYFAANGGGQITVADVVADGLRYAVIEYSNVRLFSQWNNASCVATFQVVIPEAETNTVYVHYVSMSAAFDGSSATLGAQLPDRELVFPVSHNAAGAVTNGMVIAYHLGAGTSATLYDTDGDGIGDGEEQGLGTSARFADTDGDGLEDGWEIGYGLNPLSTEGDDGAGGDIDGDGFSNGEERKLGTNPSNADTDGDGLADRKETGHLEVTNVLSWLTLPSDAVDITPQFGDRYYSLVNYVLGTPIVVDGETVTNAMIDLNGIIYLPRRGCHDNLYSMSYANLMYEICTNALVLAPYLDNLCLTTNEPASRIMVGEMAVGTNPVFVVQYENVCPSNNESREYTTNTLSFQVVIPLNGNGDIHFLYQGIVGDDMDGQGASIGVQMLGGRWAHVYSHYQDDSIRGYGDPMLAFVRRGTLTNGLDLSFDVGTGTDPQNPDTDNDGLEDGPEVDIGTAPLIPDTDGDGMNDGWECLYDGFDPLSANDANDDPDNDGATNRQEAEAGTDPGNPDTDGDGLTDGQEIVQGSDPNDRADTIPVRWVTVTGDLGAGQTKTVSETVTLPAGAIAFVGVFVHSEEYPDYTGEASEYNDRLSWIVEADGNQRLDNMIAVNDEDGRWVAAETAGQSVGGMSPVVLKDSAIYHAPANSNLSVSVQLGAQNVRDGQYPSTVMVGIFPLKIVQANMPQGVGGGGTTDGGTSYLRQGIPTNGVAYITAQPAAPELTAQFKSLPEWINVTWSMTLVSERSDHRFDGIDDRTLPPVELRGSSAYYITLELRNEIVGGRCTLNVQVGDLPFFTYPFYIRGKNPLDATARAYITANVDAEFQPYAWMIAKHESKAGNRVYNQFNAANNQYKELPNWGTPYGWGIAQIDKGRNGDSTAEVYNWHANVGAMNATLRDKRARFDVIIGMYRAAYQNDASTQWFEPDNVTTNVNGILISARQWSIMTLYNGAQGTHPLPFPGQENYSTPIHFDPVATNWVLYTNSKDYVPVVYGDANETEVE